MKKFLILTLAIFAFATGAFAQETQKHITFKGIPLGQEKAAFIEALKKVGFRVEHDSDDGAILRGDFAGHSNCQAIVLWSETSKVVWKAAALVEETTWFSLKKTYDAFKESLTEKYGKPTNSFEFFSNPYYEGDGYELSALRQEKAHFLSGFDAEGGIVGLEMKYAAGKYIVSIGYEDALAAVNAQSEKNASIMSDL